MLFVLIESNTTLNLWDGRLAETGDRHWVSAKEAHAICISGFGAILRTVTIGGGPGKLLRLWRLLRWIGLSRWGRPPLYYFKDWTNVF